MRMLKGPPTRPTTSQHRRREHSSRSLSCSCSSLLPHPAAVFVWGGNLQCRAMFPLPACAGEEAGKAGLKLSLLLGLGAWNAIQFGDVLNDFSYAVRPYEVDAGSTNRTLAEAVALLSDDFSARQHLNPPTHLPDWLWKRLKARKLTRQTTEVVMNLRRHIYGPSSANILRACRKRLAAIEVDRLRVKPIVKITGEFWAQTTEGDGNFKMSQSSSSARARQVIVDPLGHVADVPGSSEEARRPAQSPRRWTCPRRAGPLRASGFLRAWRMGRRRPEDGPAAGSGSMGGARPFYRQRYHTLCRALGGVPHELIEPGALAEGKAEPVLSRA